MNRLHGLVYRFNILFNNRNFSCSHRVFRDITFSLANCYSQERYKKHNNNFKRVYVKHDERLN